MIEPLSSVATNIVSGLLLVVLMAVLRYFRGFLGRVHPALRQAVVALLFVVYSVANLLAIENPIAKLVFLGTSLLVGAFVWIELRRFWDVGIVGVDRTVVGGIDYRRSLALCRNSLDFLGIGASKLTDLRDEFEKAVNRCHREDRAVRFLLSAPNAESLVRMARQAGRMEDEYQRRVRGSLEHLAELKLRRAKNLEIRLYSETPLFRLMFIDDSLCLATPYVLGEGDGSRLPQLHLHRRSMRRDVNTLYSAFKRYFERLWESAERWDNFRENDR